MPNNRAMCKNCQRWVAFSFIRWEMKQFFVCNVCGCTYTEREAKDNWFKRTLDGIDYEGSNIVGPDWLLDLLARRIYLDRNEVGHLHQWYMNLLDVVESGPIDDSSPDTKKAMQDLKRLSEKLEKHRGDFYVI